MLKTTGIVIFSAKKKKKWKFCNMYIDCISFILYTLILTDAMSFKQ
jgi:hypothetical protein